MPHDAARAALTALKRAALLLDVPAPPPARRRFGRWLNRPRRVLLTLALMWVVATFDLGFTLAEWGTLHFVETNPLAAKVLGGPTQLIVAFKFGLLGLATVILLGLRRHLIAELACWFLLASQAYVGLRWYTYFDCLLHDYINPMISAP
jgi:hypothetical protein